MRRFNLVTILLLTLLLSFIFLLVKYYQFGQKNLEIFNQIPTTSPQKTVTINSTVIPVEIANTEDKWKKGLSDRDSLEANSGILFDFGRKDIKFPFWMKDMRFPIDILFINDGKIIKIHKDVPNPAPNTPDSKLPFYISEGVYDYVLEVNANFCDKNLIKEGDSVQLPD